MNHIRGQQNQPCGVQPKESPHNQLCAQLQLPNRKNTRWDQAPVLLTKPINFGQLLGRFEPFESAPRSHSIQATPAARTNFDRIVDFVATNSNVSDSVNNILIISAVLLVSNDVKRSLSQQTGERNRISTSKTLTAGSSPPWPYVPNVKVPCEIMNAQRYWIPLSYLQNDAVHAIIKLDRYSHIKKHGKVHFPKEAYDKVKKVLKSLAHSHILDDPPAGRRSISLPRYKVPTRPKAVEVVCEVMNRQSYFIKSESLPLGARNALDAMKKLCIHSAPGKCWIFEKEKYSQVHDMLIGLRSPVKLGPEPESSKAGTPKVTKSRKRESASQRVTRKAIERLAAEKSRNTDSGVREIKTTRWTSPKAEFSRLKRFEIPGFKIIKHLESLQTVPGSDGIFYKKFKVVLPDIDAKRILAAKNTQKIIMRLVQSKTGEFFQEVGNGMIIRQIRLNGKVSKFQTQKAGHFMVDISKYFTGGEPCTVEISAKIDECETDDVVVYYISIVTMLDIDEMLKILQTKSLPLKRTRKLVADKQAEAARNGILIGDLNLLVSLKCPLGKNRMITPCRGVFCDYYICFDARNFLHTFETKKLSNWKCPVCDSHLDYEDLRVDSFFSLILKSIGNDCNNCNIKIDASGSFSVDSTGPNDGTSETIALLEEDLMDILSSDDENAARVQHKNKYFLQETKVEIYSFMETKYQPRPNENCATMTVFGVPPLPLTLKSEPIQAVAQDDSLESSEILSDDDNVAGVQHNYFTRRIKDDIHSSSEVESQRTPFRDDRQTQTSQVFGVKRMLFETSVTNDGFRIKVERL